MDRGDYLLILDEVERKRREIRERHRAIMEAENCMMAMMAMVLGALLVTSLWR